LSTPSISILLPVYNAAPFLAECLDTILFQTEKNWELLAVNDFSTDQSWDILQQYASEDARIHIFQNTSKGIIPALHLAFAKSKGTYITRMDADDQMHPLKLYLLKSELIKKGKGYLSTARVQYFSANELGDGYFKYQNWLNSLCELNSHFREIYKECVIPSPCWMMHREDLISCGAFEPNTYPEDYDLTFRFYENGMKVTSVPTILHYWRDHPTRTSRNDPHYENQQYFDLKLPYFLKLDYDSEKVLVLWGAGKKGKLIAKKFIDNNIFFKWTCNNPKKWGKEIYGVLLENSQQLHAKGGHSLLNKKQQIIVAVANPDDQVSIRNSLMQNHLKEGVHFFFFC